MCATAASPRLAHLDGETAREEIDADGMIVAPGIVDAHTHYDPQITFDPYATMSCFHGVTTVVAGNCGFSVAPCKPEDRDFLAGIFARVENMDPIALSAITWDEFVTFPEFLASRAGRLGVELRLLRRPLQPAALGDGRRTRPTRAATDDEIAEMRAMVADAMAAGAAGVSSSAAPTHLDLDDRPGAVARREPRRDAGAGRGRRSCRRGLDRLPARQRDRRHRRRRTRTTSSALGTVSGLPVVIQGLGGRNKTDAPTATWEAAQAFLDRATDAGAPVYSMLIARPFDRPIVIDETNFHYLAVPSWDRMLKLPHDERMARAARPGGARRDCATRSSTTTATPRRAPPCRRRCGRAVYVDEVDEARARRTCQSRSIADIADEQGVAPADVVLDLALDEDLATASAGGPRARSGRRPSARPSSTRA